MKQPIAAILCAAQLVACGNDHNTTAATPRLKAELARTSYGVVHVQADNFGGLGYGLAYAYAQDNICMLADSLLTVRGERSRYFGPDAFATRPHDGEYGAALDFIDLRNEDSDFFFKGYLDLEQLRAGYASEPAAIRELLTGYAAGYNRYLREYGADLPAACRNATWVKPIGIDDLYLLIAEKALHATGEVFAQAIVAAARDSLTAATRPMAGANPVRSTLPPPASASNALAIGRDASVSGRGLLLANPHFPWTSTDRFYQLHMTLPGIYDVMGVSLGGLPIVVIGFNKDVAWTHTITKAVHFTTFRLQLDPADPSGTSYFYDGQRRKMSSRTATIAIRQADGSLSMKTRTFYFSHLGAVMILPGDGNGWSASTALVLGDPNRNNTRMLRQWMEIGRSVSVSDLKARLDAVAGLPWVNTIAADRDGSALYADASVVPDMGMDKFRSDCLLSEEQLLFDGSRSACAWRSGSGTPGIVPPAEGPSMLRTDYVGNSNDGYWLSNARQLLGGPPPLGYSPLYGPVGVEQHLRTRSGFLQIEEMLAARRRLRLEDLAELQFSNRIYAAELILPELVPACSAANDPALEPACSSLGTWDRRANLDSRGAVLFREFWNQAAQIPDKWAFPFNAADPVHTPHGLAASAVQPMLGALRDTVLKLQKLGIPLDGRLGDYQYEVRNGIRTPVHGGIGDIDGCYNSIHMASPLNAEGYRNVAWGSSYIQLTTFDNAGPIAQGILVYGQSTNPASPYYADQIGLYSDKQLPGLPFSREAVQADKNYKVMTLIEY